MERTMMKTTVNERQREGVLVKPNSRLSEKQVQLIDEVSRELLEDPGVLSYNQQAVDIFRNAGATIEEAEEGCQRVRISSDIVDRALKTAPSLIVLGARDPNNKLILDAHEPRVRFGSGAETNVWLDIAFEDGMPSFTRQNGSIERLCRAAHLCDNLEHLDFFIRCVNIRDEEVTAENKDVNKFYASLNNITKHVQAGLTSLGALDDVILLGKIASGGEESFQKAPVLSFIACVVKSPLQIVDDTAATFIEVSRKRVPIVVSSCPMGGATGPFDEFGIVVLINAELLAGVTLNQLVSPGAPVLYGAVPVRTRLDNLNDMYGAPEFVQYGIDCAQMARHYGLPCYSTAGVGDVDVPGIQATAEKMLTLATIPMGGPQYVHYAFGLLERTNVFCPEQAILDDAHIGAIKELYEQGNVTLENKDKVLSMIREVMNSSHKTFIYNLPCPSRERVYACYPLENEEGGALLAAHERYQNLLRTPRKNFPCEVRSEILAKVSGILPQNTR